MLQLVFIEGKLAGQTLLMTFERKWFGRQPTCDVVLDEEGISRVHCAIEKRGEQYFVVDNKSESGTFLNGRRMQVEPIRAGDQIRIGGNTLEVQEVSEDQLTEFRFIVEWKTGNKGTKILIRPKVVLGRKSVCHIQLDHPAVSPLHAAIEKRGDRIVVTDSSSQAGTYVNGRRIVEEELKTGDVLTIFLFSLAVTIQDNRCRLSVSELPEAQIPVSPAVESLPSTYQNIVAATEQAAKPSVTGAVLPSAEVTALPKWMQSSAPIWVPTSDILPNRFRFWMTLGGLIAVFAFTVYLWAINHHGIYAPAPTASVHTSSNEKFRKQLAALGIKNDCAACHVGFQSVRDSSCSKCHTQIAVADYHRKQKDKPACMDCHAEHQGAGFRADREVASGCMAAGCHPTFHQKTVQRLNFRGVVPAVNYENQVVKTPLSVAYNAPFRAPTDVMHTKHAGLKGECLNCHISVVPFIRESSEAIRMRCIQCHGFGSEATIEARCYSCHFEHKTSRPEAVLAAVKFSDQPGAIPFKRAEAHQSLILFLATLVAIPLFYFVAVSVDFRLEQKNFSSQIQSEGAGILPIVAAGTPGAVTDIAPLAAAPSIAEAKPSENQTPNQNLRPQIDVDLCVGCGTCVHVCPFNVLEIVNEKAIAARLDDCTGYAACALECPTNAIVLVPGGPMQQVELPLYNDTLETNVGGLYLAGEVTGKALIKIAINQGKQVVESIMKSPPPKNGAYDIIVVGGGPAGVSTGLAAKKEGLKVLVLEQGSVANTIQNYPRHKFVMAEPVMIPLYGPLWMEDASKETLLEQWTEIITKTGLIVNEQEKVLSVVRGDGIFEVTAKKGETVQTYKGYRVVIAVGKRGSPRKLGVPGEDSPKVAYSLLDAESYHGKAVCVVGGGDSGIEAANGLARAELENKVWIVHRTADFGKAKPRNQKKIKKAMDEGRIKAFFNAGVAEIKEASVVVKTEAGPVEIENDFLFVMIGGENPKKFLSQCGIEFSKRALG